jgi:hypothetical protein
MFPRRRRNIPEDALRVNDEESAQGNSLFLNEDAIFTGDGSAPVCDERELQVGTESAFFSWL